MTEVNDSGGLVIPKNKEKEIILKQCLEKAALRATVDSIICKIENNLDLKVAAKRCMNDMVPYARGDC